MRARCLAAAMTASMLLWALPALAQSQCGSSSARTGVLFETTLGSFEILLCDQQAPASVANFLSYVDDGSYGPTDFIHRSEQDPLDIIQGGGFYFAAGGQNAAVPAKDPIDLELAGLTHRRGTIAMALVGDPNTGMSIPNSATSQWFVNVHDNRALDTGYAVFGEVVSGIDVVDAIAALDTFAFNVLLSQLPLLPSYPGDGSSPIDDVVYVTAVTNLPEPATALQTLAALTTLAALARRREI